MVDLDSKLLPAEKGSKHGSDLLQENTEEWGQAEAVKTLYLSGRDL